MSKAFRIFSKVWAWFAGGVLVLSIVAHLVVSASLWEAITDIQGWFSPFNILNWILVLVLFSPAIGAGMLADKLERRMP